MDNKPQDDPTNRRMNFVCYAAAQAWTPPAVVDGIHAALDDDPPCDGNELDDLPPPCVGAGGTIVDDWRLMAGPPYVGECDEQARLMVVGLKLIGGSGSAYYTYASTDTDVEDKESKVQDGKMWWLKFDFDDDGTVDNNFEGAVYAAGRYYAVWPSLSADSKCLLLHQVGPDEYGATQRWVHTDWPHRFEDPIIGDPLPGTEDYPSCP